MLALAALAAVTALASPLQAPTEPMSIVGGEPVGACAWPSVVSLGGVCTGTLVHPRVVLYAAHCGDGFTSVELGNAVAPGHARTVAVERCEVDDEGTAGAGRDRAYCVLTSAVDDVPIVPPIDGCEAAALQVGAAATLVGFGESQIGYGDKRAVTTTLTDVTSAEIELGGEGRDTCRGDSGGPAFIQLPSGHWRAFGIVSRGETCGEGGVVVRMDEAARWAESRAGFDLTPCFDRGRWSPTAACGGFSAAPQADDGDWGRGCAQPLEDLGRSCGAAFDDEGDVTPPEVWFLAPEDEQLEGDVEIGVHAADEGLGVHEITLFVDSDPVGSAFLEHASFSPPLRGGAYELRALATDRAGNEAEARSSLVVIDAPDRGEPALDADTTGCSCRSSDEELSLSRWAWMFSVVLASRRRTRS